MQVIKRNGKPQPVDFNEILTRIQLIAAGLTVDCASVAQATIIGMKNGSKTSELDELAASIAEERKFEHPDYAVLAGRLIVDNLHKSTPEKFSESITLMQDSGELIRDDVAEFVAAYAGQLDAFIVPERDYMFGYFGLHTLLGGYLLGSKRGTEKCTPYERPQHMYMRAAIAAYIGLAQTDPELALTYIAESYDLQSRQLYSHASPTLFNACTVSSQLLSCFLLGTHDSVGGIMKNLRDCSLISMSGGGLGVHMSNVRCAEQLVVSSNGRSSGLPTQLTMYNAMVNVWDQGSKRKGALAVYIEPHHGDILEILNLKRNQDSEKNDPRARDLMYALWTSELFWTKYRTGADWCLFSENTAPGLSDVYDGMLVCKHCGVSMSPAYAQYVRRPHADPCGPATAHEWESVNAFTELYERYAAIPKRAVKTIPAATIMHNVYEILRDTGVPYFLNKDAANRRSNQMNLGTVKSSNLCCEIMEVSDNNTYACCVLSSINLRAMVRPGPPAEAEPADEQPLLTGNIRRSRPSVAGPYFDFAELARVVKTVTRALDFVVDSSAYKVKKCAKNSQSTRAIGIGVQGEADAFIALGLNYLSAEAEALSIRIAETIYFAALEASSELAELYGAYEGFEGSPAAQGILQFDMWALDEKRAGREPRDLCAKNADGSNILPWGELRPKIRRGLRNSLMVAYMPTATTCNIIGNNESFEPLSSCIYRKTTTAGTFTVTNESLIRKLVALGIWDEQLKNEIVAAKGSVAGIERIPADIRGLYATVWDMKQAPLIRRAALRGAFVDQSQSLNIHMPNNRDSTYKKVISLGMKLGLKTLSYYMRTRAATTAISNVAQAITPSAAENLTTEAKQPICDDHSCCSG